MASIDTNTITVKKFCVSDLKHDMRITLFNSTEVHVHAFMLKPHSTFFRKFLDSPEKKPSTTKFKYEWVSEVEEDGSWHIVAKSNALNIDFKLDEDEHPESWHIQTFIKMIGCTFYGVPFSLDKYTFQTATELADYYCCLPALSRNISGCLVFCRKGFVNQLEELAVEAIEPAYKLRHAALFRDCAIFITGSLEKYHTLPKIQPEIDRVLETMRNRINSLVAITHMRLFTHPNSNDHPDIQLMINAMASYELHSDRLTLPKYFGTLATFHPDSHFTTLLGPVIKNNLALGVCADLSATCWPCPYNTFLCGELSDDELPWDINAIDW